MKPISRLPLVFALAVAATGPCAHAAVDRYVTGFPELPKDARAVAERSLGCNHFAGEFGGDGGERDREVTAQMRKLKCDRIEKDLAVVKRKYRRDKAILRALAEAEAGAE